jgi:hypothetical protein
MDNHSSQTVMHDHNNFDKLHAVCLKLIEENLDTRDKARLKLTCKESNVWCVIALYEKRVFLLTHLMSSVGNNYHLTTGEIPSHNFRITYLLNIYINTAIFFQKVKTHTGIVLYVRLMTFDRRNVDVDNIKKIIDIFLESQPITSQGITHYKVDRFLDIINQT